MAARRAGHLLRVGVGSAALATIPALTYNLKVYAADDEGKDIKKIRITQETTDKVKEKFEIGKAHTQGLLDYLQNDPGMVPRVAVITVAGLGGVVAGYRGGAMRKLFYSSVAIAAATSLCYPNEAVALTSEAYDSAMASVKSLWPGEDASAGPQVVQESSPTTMDNKTQTVRGKPAVSGDPGQSKEEDKDMYTTRGS